MTDVTHDGFTLTRDIAASPATVFALWADPAKKRLWFAEGKAEHSIDFRVGGTESNRFEVEAGPGAGTHENVTHYLEIAPNERIVLAYTMAMNGRVHSASLATVLFEARDGGTHLNYTEQMTLIGASDGPQGRAHGWGALLDAMERQVQGATA